MIGLRFDKNGKNGGSKEKIDLKNPHSMLSATWHKCGLEAIVMGWMGLGSIVMGRSK